jgi:hypothetical protein
MKVGVDASVRLPDEVEAYVALNLKWFRWHGYS